MFLKVLKHELRGITRDRMYAFFVFYEIIIIGVALFLIPYLKDQFETDTAANIAMIVLLLMSGIVFGAITGFSLLDDNDDGVMFSLKVTPINVKVYVFLKLFVSFIFSVIATIALILITGIIRDASALTFIMIVILSSFQAPIVALIMNTFASNKVEGFVIMKLTGLTLTGPILALFLTDATEFLVGIFPGFWPARLLTMEIIPLEYTFSQNWIYFLLGMVVNVFAVLAFMKMYQKKHQIN